jgi:hypothetical protein
MNNAGYHFLGLGWGHRDPLKIALRRGGGAFGPTARAGPEVTTDDTEDTD